MEITNWFYTYKSVKEVKLENDDGMEPSKEFPWSLLQKQFEEADYNCIEVLYKVEYHGMKSSHPLKDIHLHWIYSIKWIKACNLSISEGK